MKKSANRHYKKISFCGFELYQKDNSIDSTYTTMYYRILGLPFFKIKNNIHLKKVSVFGIQLYKRETPTKNFKRIFVFGVPVYSKKICDYKIKRRFLFLRNTSKMTKKSN